VQPYPPVITPRSLLEVATNNNYQVAANGYSYRDLTTVEVLDVRDGEKWLSVTQLPVPCHRLYSTAVSTPCF